MLGFRYADTATGCLWTPDRPPPTWLETWGSTTSWPTQTWPTQQETWREQWDFRLSNCWKYTESARESEKGRKIKEGMRFKWQILQTLTFSDTILHATFWPLLWRCLDGPATAWPAKDWSSNHIQTIYCISYYHIMIIWYTVDCLNNLNI